MGIAAYQLDKYLTRTILLNEPKGLCRLRCPKECEPSSGGRQPARSRPLRHERLGGIAGLIGTIVAVIVCLFPRS